MFLDYEKHDVIGYNSDNSRNGYYSRTLDTKYGEISVTIPKDWNGNFKQQTIPAYDRRTDSLEVTVLQLYSNLRIDPYLTTRFLRSHKTKISKKNHHVEKALPNNDDFLTYRYLTLVIWPLL